MTGKEFTLIKNFILGLKPLTCSATTKHRTMIKMDMFFLWSCYYVFNQYFDGVWLFCIKYRSVSIPKNKQKMAQLQNQRRVCSWFVLC